MKNENSHYVSGPVLYRVVAPPGDAAAHVHPLITTLLQSITTHQYQEPLGVLRLTVDGLLSLCNISPVLSPYPYSCASILVYSI